MKVYFAVKSYWPSSGGVQTVTKYMAEGLANRGYDVHVLTENISELPCEEKYNSVSIHRFEHSSVFKFNLGDKKGYQDFIEKKIKAQDVIITVCAQSFVSEWFFPIIDKVNCHKIMYMHGMRKEKVDLMHVYSLKNLFKEFLLTRWWNLYFKKNWKYIEQYDVCIHLYENDNSHSYFKSHGFKNNVIIQNSCDRVFYDNDVDLLVMEKYNIKNPYFIEVANFDENKNQLFSLKAFCQAEIDDFDIVFIGSHDNNYCKQLKSISATSAKKGKNIHILTGVPREDVISLIKNSFMCLLSSHSEYFPISLIEGMASRKAFISTAVGEVPKFVGGISINQVQEMAYWMKYCTNHLEYVASLETAAHYFAKENMYIDDKIDQLEKLIRKMG